MPSCDGKHFGRVDGSFGMVHEILLDNKCAPGGPDFEPFGGHYSVLTVWRLHRATGYWIMEEENSSQFTVTAVTGQSVGSQPDLTSFP